jgi:hypothetical protein
MRDSEEAADRLPPFLLPDANAQKKYGGQTSAGQI